VARIVLLAESTTDGTGGRYIVTFSGQLFDALKPLALRQL
jgi:hypothetical protein